MSRRAGGRWLLGEVAARVKQPTATKKETKTTQAMTQKLYLETVGCQMNVLDSELVVGSLRRQGYTLTHEATDADVILFNTCSVRQHAEDKIYSALGRLRGHKKRHPHKVVGVLGCMAQKDQELIRRRAPHVDIICGTGQLGRLAELIDEVKRTGKLQLALSLERTEARQEVERSFESYDPMRDPSMRPSRFQAYVRIMIGCDKFCTYCIVPSVRGPEQSRPHEHIVAEVRQLAAEGCKEITLLGQTVNSYNFDHGDGRRWRLSNLLAAIHDTPGIERIKFVTNFPKDMTDDLLDAVRDLPKVCQYLHVPAQSGSNEVLKRMKRLYTVEFYRDMLARCRERVPGVAISSDFIVGFCGETEESFNKSCDLVREAGFKNCFIFKYSPRPGTKGHELFADDVPEEVKKRRNNDLLAIQNAVSLADHRKQIGNTVEVLVEGPSKNALKTEPGTGPIQLTGRTHTDHIVVFDGNERLTGKTVQVTIDEATSFTLFGVVVTGEQVGVRETCPDARDSQPAPGGSARWALPLVSS
jgi:tRNA-2-methylthio-N6-dimethylallyladenosine synthase